MNRFACRDVIGCVKNDCGGCVSRLWKNGFGEGLEYGWHCARSDVWALSLLNGVYSFEERGY